MKKHPITNYREKHGLTLEAFGKLVNCQKASVHQWERWLGPSIKTAIAIEHATKGALNRRDLRPDVWGKET